MKEELEKLLERAIRELKFPKVPLSFEISKQKEHGDFATNAAFLLAKEVKKNPREVALEILKKIKPWPSWLEKAEVAGAGFINFYIHPKTFFEALQTIVKQGKKYGRSEWGKGKKVILEFVSANPTGPLNVVSARAAALGDCLGNLLEGVGYKTCREYYVNDMGGQIDLFAKSLEARLNQALGLSADLPPEGYHGEYLKEIVAGPAQKKKKLRAKELKELGLKTMVAWQKKSLENFGVAFDRWYFQSKLSFSPHFKKVMERLKKLNYLYEKEGALFFKSTSFGDDKDRVIRKQDGGYTYFAYDIAYHDHKLKNFDWAIDLLGPDHHGYIARTQAAVQALGYDPQRLTILIVQQVNLIKEEKIVKMSKRAGRLVTMDDLMEEVGKEVARFFFLQRSSNTHLDFDLELAKKETLENPIFYIQYAHARIASIFRKALEHRIKLDAKKPSLDSLDLPEEKELAKQILNFPEVLSHAAKNLEPHAIAFYCLTLAQQFQAYYSQAKHDPRYRVVDAAQPEKTNVKLYLLKNIQIVLQNALRLMGISAPERMESDAPSPL